MFYAIASLLVRGLMKLITKLEVYGLENVPLEGPLLVVANHVHFADPPLLGAVLPRKVIFMAKSELFRTLFIGLIVRAYEAFAVRRGEGDTRAIRRAVKVLSKGGALGMFPEGTRSRNGQLQPGRPGAAMIALRTGATILPVGISGTRTFLQWPRVLGRPRVIVRIGRPFRASPTSTSREEQDQLTEVIMREIAALLPSDQRGAYGDTTTAGEPLTPPAVRITRRRPARARAPRRSEI